MGSPRCRAHGRLLHSGAAAWRAGHSGAASVCLSSAPPGTAPERSHDDAKEKPTFPCAGAERAILTLQRTFRHKNWSFPTSKF